MVWGAVCPRGAGPPRPQERPGGLSPLPVSPGSAVAVRGELGGPWTRRLVPLCLWFLDGDFLPMAGCSVSCSLHLHPWASPGPGRVWGGCGDALSLGAQGAELGSSKATCPEHRVSFSPSSRRLGCGWRGRMEGPEPLFAVPGLLCRSRQLGGLWPRAILLQVVRLLSAGGEDLPTCCGAGSSRRGAGAGGTRRNSPRGWTLLPPSMMYPGFGVYLVWPWEK